MDGVRERLRAPVVWGNSFLLVKAVGSRGARVGAGEVGLRARAAVPRAVGGAADRARHRLSHVRPRRPAGRVRGRSGCCSRSAPAAVFGVNAASLGLVLLVALAVGSTRVLRDESTTAATTALVVLLAGYSSDPSMVGTRLLDTLSGSSSGCSSTSWSGRRCTIAPRHGRSTSSTIASAPCWPTSPEPCARAASPPRRNGGSSAPASSIRTSPTPGPFCARRARAAA